MSNDKLQLLIEAVQQLSMARSLEAVTAIVRTTARNLTGCDGATFILREKDKCYYADEDAISPLWKGQRFAMETCVSGWVMINKQATMITDIYADERVPAEAYRPTFVKSMAMVPIRTTDPIGAIGNYWATPYQATDSELELLQALADITSVSIENVYVYNDLEQRVAQRTSDLQRVNKELETFAHSVSHDLRSPLRTIRNYLSLLVEDYSGNLNADALDLISRAVSQANNMDELIDCLLNFSLIDKKPLVKDPVPMRTIVEDLCAALKAQEKGRKINFEINDMPDAEGDGVLLKEVWANLISNAVKYTQNKPVAEIKIGYEPSTEKPGYYVKDNGAGFDMQYYDKLFGIFQRLHTAREYNGHGIGLALTERILTRHNGNIWAKGKVDEGAEFYFSLPIN